MLPSSVPCSSSVASHSCAASIASAFLQHPDEYRDIGNSIHQRGETTKVCKNTGFQTIAQTDKVATQTPGAIRSLCVSPRHCDSVVQNQIEIFRLADFIYIEKN